MRWIGRALGACTLSLGALGCAAKATEPARAAEPRAASVASPRAAALPLATVASAVTRPTTPADRHRPLLDSALLGELELAGLEPGAYPRLEELSARQRLPVMEAFTKALGTTCTGCHVSERDYAAETAAKQLTRHMWNDFTAPLRLDGKQLFCDSCHQGSAATLHRADRAGVSAFMKEQFAARLATSAGKVTCETCHGTPFEPHVFERRWGVKG